MKRTDIHCPSAIVPTDYEYVAIECMKIEGIESCYVVMDARRTINEHMARTGGKYSSHAHGGNCHVCGAACIYTHLFYHAKSNTYIRTGNDCTDRLDYASVAEDMDTFRHAIKPALKLAKGKRKAEVTLANDNMSAAWAIYQSSTEGKEESIVRDIVSKLVKYGGFASSKQAEFLRGQLSRIANRATIQTQQAARTAAAANCPEGRLEITGHVVSTKSVMTDFGMTQKMLVEHASGYRVWVTIPSGLCAERGVEVTFTATITPSKNDAKFGFGSRPSVSRKAVCA